MPETVEMSMVNRPEKSAMTDNHHVGIGESAGTCITGEEGTISKGGGTTVARESSDLNSKNGKLERAS
jgi:hypothetical protein